MTNIENIWLKRALQTLLGHLLPGESSTHHRVFGARDLPQQKRVCHAGIWWIISKISRARQQKLALNNILSSDEKDLESSSRISLK